MLCTGSGVADAGHSVVRCGSRRAFALLIRHEHVTVSSERNGRQRAVSGYLLDGEVCGSGADCAAGQACGGFGELGSITLILLTLTENLTIDAGGGARATHYCWIACTNFGRTCSCWSWFESHPPPRALTKYTDVTIC